MWRRPVPVVTVMRKLTEDEMSGSSSDSEQSTSSCVTVGGGSGGGGTFRMAAKAVLTCRPNSHPFQVRLKKGV